MCFKVFTKWHCGHVSPRDPDPYEKCDQQTRTIPCSEGFVDCGIKVKFMCAACKSQDEQRDRVARQRRQAAETKSKERWAAESGVKKMKVESKGVCEAKRKWRSTAGKDTDAFKIATRMFQTTPPPTTTRTVSEAVRLNQVVIDEAQRTALQREPGRKRKRDHEKARDTFAALVQDAPHADDKTDEYVSAFESSLERYEYDDEDAYGLLGDYEVQEEDEGFEGDGDGFVHYRPG